MIEFKNVSFKYGEDTALNNINLKISEGESIAFLGLNGSGKTSLFRMMNGLLTPSSGYVSVDGMRTDEEDKLWEVRKRVGMIFQNPESQIVGTTVEEDIAFGMENIGISRSEMVKRVDEVLKFVDMENLKKIEPYHLSGGQKQLLCVASVLAMEPKYVIMDEPTSMVDPVGRDRILAVMIDMNEIGKTLMFSTHILDEIVVAQRVVYLRKGEVVFDGKPMEIMEKVKEEFGTSNFIEFQSRLYRHGFIEHFMKPKELSERLRKLCR